MTLLHDCLDQFSVEVEGQCRTCELYYWGLWDVSLFLSRPRIHHKYAHKDLSSCGYHGFPPVWTMKISCLSHCDLQPHSTMSVISLTSSYSQVRTVDFLFTHSCNTGSRAHLTKLKGKSFRAVEGEKYIKISSFFQE